MSSEEWHQNERWADAKRCAVESCRQPLVHPDSITSGVCARVDQAHEQARQEAATAET